MNDADTFKIKYFKAWALFAIAYILVTLVVGFMLGAFLGLILGAVGYDIQTIATYANIFGIILAIIVSYFVFRWAVSEMARVCRESLDKAGITAADLDAFIPHQANNRITDALVRALDLPDSVTIARDIITTGNTSAASVPLAMDRMLASGEVPHGGTALLVGFGAGLVFASQVVTLP